MSLIPPNTRREDALHITFVGIALASIVTPVASLAVMPTFIPPPYAPPPATVPGLPVPTNPLYVPYVPPDSDAEDDLNWDDGEAR